MASISQFKKWAAENLQRARFRKTKLIIREAAKRLGADAVFDVNGDYAIIATPPFALLLTPVGDDALQAYCSFFDEPVAGSEKPLDFEFHQHGQPLGKAMWVWFPRLEPHAAAAYRFRRLAGSRNGYEWSADQVGADHETRSKAMSSRELAEGLGARIADDFRRLCVRLRSASPPEPN